MNHWNKKNTGTDQDPNTSTNLLDLTERDNRLINVDTDTANMLTWAAEPHHFYEAGAGAPMLCSFSSDGLRL
jgi:hypothetical protein